MNLRSSAGLPNPWSALVPDDWEQLARTYGTPFYLIDADAVRRRIRIVRDAFEGLVRVYYAVKANPNVALLRAVQPEADGVDISSTGEMEQALQAGFEAHCMSFAGPAKTAAELEDAIRAGVGSISVESVREIDRCADVAARGNSRARILLRVNPSAAFRGFGIKMGGRATQFGIDEEALPVAEERVLAHREHVDLRGVHVYVGSQCFDPAEVAAVTVDALRIAQGVAQRTGIPATTVNLGGGFGVTSGEGRRELDVQALGRLLMPALRSHHREYGSGCELFFELGRYLTAEAGIYVTRVIASKSSRGKSFAICDGGLHHHLAAAGTFGAALRSNYTLRNLSRPDGELRTQQIAGPSCNPTDLLGVDAELPALEDADLLGVLMSGSYGLTASPLLFLGRRTPVELVRTEQGIVVGRRSYQITDFN